MKTETGRVPYYLKRAGMALLLSVVAVSFLMVYANSVALQNSTLYAEFLHMLQGMFRNVRYYFAIGVMGIIAFLFLCKGKAVTEFLYTHRYLICLAVFVCCVALQLNGSSIGIWSGVLRQPESGILAGASRPIRSDEWFVSTPMAFSQYFNFPRAFSYFGDVLRGTSTDMFLEYGQPVRDIAVLFRPFHWGYLFLPPAYGLSFFWCGRLIALFLVSFEFGMLLTKGNKILSLTFSLLVGLAPVVQWWFAINGLVEMLIFLQASGLLLKKYLETDSRKKRGALLAGIFLCAGGYVLTMYPAWMIPLGYILAGSWIGIFLTASDRVGMKRADLVILAVEAVVFFVLIGYIFYRSRETILALMHTEYPGNRLFTGGHAFSTATNYLANIWYAIFGSASYANVCESARFIDFFPVCYLPSVWYMVKEKGRDKLLLSLLVVSVFLEIYALAGFPSILARITLLANCNSHRVLAVVGLCNLFLLFRSLAVIQTPVRRSMAIIGGGVLAVLCVCSNAVAFPEYYEHYHLIGVTVLLAVLLFVSLFRTGEKKGQICFLTTVCLVAVMSGLLVNPIRRGISHIYESETLQQLREVAEAEPEALWIVEGEDNPVINLPIMVGARTINSTNVYPAMERWEGLDNGENRTIYNRYAYIRIDLSDTKKAEFSLLQDDFFQVSCSISDLDKLQVRYILTERELSSYPELQLVREWDSWRIYELTTVS